MGKIVNGGILEQAEFLACNTPAGHRLHINLNPLARAGHLLVRPWLVGWFLAGLWKQPKFTQRRNKLSGRRV